MQSGICLRQLLLAAMTCAVCWTFGNNRDFSGLLGRGSLAASTTSPNIVLIVADDLGHGHLGCYGQDKILTPRIDRLAAEGLKFTRAYAGSAVCAPSRSVLMTGQHTGHTPVRANGPGMRIQDSDVTMAEVLKKRGYSTGGFGKWGLGQSYTPGRAYDQGFDLWVGQYDQVHAHFYYPWFVWKNDQRLILEGNQDGRREQYVHDVIHREALAFIRQQAEGGQPFFAYLPYIIPHVELLVPEEDEEPYRSFGWPKLKLPDPREGYLGSDDAYVTYAGMISRLDRHVGEVVDLIDELGIGQKTLIIFTSDNGAQGSAWEPLQKFFDGSGGLRGLKGSLYEGGIRVPMIARWTGRVDPGSRTDIQTCFYDLLPTFADVASISPPADVDGISILPTITGDATGQERHNYLYWELGDQTAVISKQWKAIKPQRNSDWELYNLSEDPSEQKNLADLRAEVLQQLVSFAEQAHTQPRPMPSIPRAEYRMFIR